MASVEENWHTSGDFDIATISIIYKLRSHAQRPRPPPPTLHFTLILSLSGNVFWPCKLRVPIAVGLVSFMRGDQRICRELAIEYFKNDDNVYKVQTASYNTL